jgi:hypothetical protein
VLYQLSYISRYFRSLAHARDFARGLPLTTPPRENRACRGPRLRSRPQSGSTLERETGIEPATNSLEGCDSTTELLPPAVPTGLLPFFLRLTQHFRFATCWAIMTPRLRRSDSSLPAAPPKGKPICRVRGLIRCQPPALALRSRLEADVHSSWCSRRSLSIFLFHDQVRSANIARMASVANLNFGSVSVVHANIASSAYTPKATTNLFITTPRTSGAQGRIRTSVARKERQIYSLLPLTTRPPVHVSTEHSHRVPRPGTINPCCQRTLRRALRKTPQQPRTRTSARLARVGCCWNQFSRRAARLVWLAPATAAAGGALSVAIWSWRRDLNPRPSDYKSDALPAELRQLAWRDTPASHQAQFFTPARTITELNTTVIHVQATAGFTTTSPSRETSTRHFHPFAQPTREPGTPASSTPFHANPA